MNEQLTVKNFGPIKDATVDFKRVTVFIGPTGGGKSTLAKLAAIARDKELMHPDPVYIENRKSKFAHYNILSHLSDDSTFNWVTPKSIINYNKGDYALDMDEKSNQFLEKQIFAISELLKSKSENKLTNLLAASELLKNYEESFNQIVAPATPVYVPSERIFIAAINTAWPGLMSENIGLPKTLTAFANLYFQARESVEFLRIHFLEIDFFRLNQQDLIVLANQLPLKIAETASGIQSVTPLLVLLEHLSRNTEQAQSFIIEEPELNLYPTAQQGLLDWLVEKCTKGANDLTITTHSPYILSHLNLLLYAYQVAEKHPDRAEEVAELVPRVSWINPKEFACYQVENGGVTSLVSEDLGLIDDNGLDNLSGDAADAFDNLIRLSKGVARK